MALITGGLNFISGGLAPILLVLVKQQQGSSLLYGTILTIGGLGAILGSLLGAPLQKRFRLGTIVIVVLWVDALTFPCYARWPHIRCSWV